MKILNILFVIVLLSCTDYKKVPLQEEKADNNEALTQMEKTDITDQAYSTVSINQFALTLKNINGKCTLFYKNERQKIYQTEETISLDMDAPCEFIRMPKTLEPLLHTYGKKIKKHILMVTGGPPDTMLKDQFQPQGCGTEIQKILIFDDKIELGEKITDTSSKCPSAGLDEVYFAT